MKKLVLILLMVSVAAAACSSDAEGEKEKEGETALPACTATPSPPAEGSVLLPEKFPTPDGVTYSSTEQSGPSTITTGFARKGLESVYESYAEALDDKGGYSIDKKEREERDAEVFFATEDSTGQVKLEAECNGYTEIRVTVRPR